MAEKIIDKIDQIHERHFDKIDDDIVEVSFYERMGERLVRLGSPERWDRKSAAEWYGVSL